MQDILAARPAEGSRAAEEAPSIVQAMFRERWIVLACVLVGGLLGVGLSQFQQQVYTAQSRLFLSASSDFDPIKTDGNGDTGRFVPYQVEVLGSTEVLNRVITTLGLDISPFRLAKDITVESGTDSGVITVSAEAADPKTAKAIADGIPAAYREYARDLVADRVRQALSQTSTNSARSAINTAAAVYGDGVADVEAAELPTRASRPQPIRDALILALIGLLAATGYALYAQSFSRRRVGPVEASAIFGAPVLSEVPDRGRITAADAIAAAYSEPGDAYRMAAVGLDYIRGTAPGVFLVTAPHDGAGSSLTALNLAAASADHGRRVFLLNIEDTVRPQSESDAGVRRVPLHDLAQGRIDLGHAVERRAASRAQFGIIRLQVLQPVQGHPVPDVQAILDQLPDDTDLVLLDAPPLPASSASFVLAGQLDAAVVVVDEVTTPADLDELQRRCRLAGIPVAGVLFNHLRGRSPAGHRRRRAAVGAVPPRMYDTAPRGLPLRTGAPAAGEVLRLPDAGPEPATIGYGPPAQSGYGHDQLAHSQSSHDYAQGGEPWSSVTRVTPGWEQEGTQEHT